MELRPDVDDADAHAAADAAAGGAGAGMRLGRPRPASTLSTASSVIARARTRRGRADVRQDEHVRRSQQRVVGWQRLGVGDVERRTRDRAVVQGAA